MIAQPSPEAVELVAAALRTEGVLSIAVWQGIDYSVEQQQNDAKSEALFQYIAALEADRNRLDFLSHQWVIVNPGRKDGVTLDCATTEDGLRECIDDAIGRFIALCEVTA